MLKRFINKIKQKLTSNKIHDINQITIHKFEENDPFNKDNLIFNDEISDGNTVQFSPSDLKEDTTYWYRIVETGANGEKWYSKSVEFNCKGKIR